MAQVQFFRGTKAEYDAKVAQGEISTDAIYYITDKGILYVGDTGTACSDTGWVSLGVMTTSIVQCVSPYDQYGGYPGIAYRVINNNHIYIRGVVKIVNSALANKAISSATNNAVVANLNPIPAKYRPKFNIPNGQGGIDTRGFNVYVSNRSQKRDNPINWVLDNGSGYILCEGFTGLTGAQSADWAVIDFDYFI